VRRSVVLAVFAIVLIVIVPGVVAVLVAVVVALATHINDKNTTITLNSATEYPAEVKKYCPVKWIP
jgi:hypothetical protein